MLRTLLWAVVPVLALTGAVRAEDAVGANEFSDEASFEVDALTAAFSDDLDVAPAAGSVASEEIDAEAACYGFGYRSWRYGYAGWRGYRTWSSFRRPYRYGWGGRWGGYGGYYRPFVRRCGYCW